MNSGPQYVIRYRFEWLGECFWSANDEARGRFGYAIFPEMLPLSEQTIERTNELMAWHDQALNWDYPPDPGPWRQEECERFNYAARELLNAVRQELGSNFEVIDDFVEEKEDPELDAYSQDPKGFVRQKQID
ncbi:hypothetical protein [Dictyobacter formicarum]|uniref:Uncharacterized protein n=1 Tax=Dictyobacter formicarum TaxID=2778368 RepID=A0ABQ3VG95_9CHLR|nr:hypothetical protein [Dictyobacter formicarum]GHO84838.1 hypothetical protein KSZ_28440 [Dictyobacter formicarum]